VCGVRDGGSPRHRSHALESEDRLPLAGALCDQVLLLAPSDRGASLALIVDHWTEVPRAAALAELRGLVPAFRADGVQSADLLTIVERLARQFPPLQ
jgi:hypothetical protein